MRASHHSRTQFMLVPTTDGRTGLTWMCPQCRTQLRLNQFHTCSLRRTQGIIYFVDGAPRARW